MSRAFIAFFMFVGSLILFNIAMYILDLCIREYKRQGIWEWAQATRKERFKRFFGGK